MRNCVIKIFAAAVVALYSASALALFDGGLLVGKRWYEDEDGDGTAAQEITLSGHVDPIPMVPVAFGGAYSMITVSDADLSEGSTVTMSELGLEVVGWLPMVPIVTPYAKFRYILSGELKSEYTGGSSTADITGHHLNFGVEFSLVPMVALQLEVGQSSQEFKADGFDAYDMSSKSVLLGVKAGL